MASNTVYLADYLTAAATARRWGISRERVCQLARAGRIPGAIQLTGWRGQWAIPRRAGRPAPRAPWAMTRSAEAVEAV